MVKTLTKAKTDKYDKAILSGIDNEIKKGMTTEEKVELKSYAIKKKVKLGKYTFNG